METERTEHMVKVGDFYISPFGPIEGFSVDLGDWMLHLSTDEILTMLADLGVEGITRPKWSQREKWRIEGENVVFDLTTGTATPNPTRHVKTIPAIAVKEACQQIKCPHLTKPGEFTCKSCRNCAFWSGWWLHRCDFDSPWLEPARKINDVTKAYIGERTYHQRDFGQAHAWMRFKVMKPDAMLPTVWNRLYRGLRQSRCELINENSGTYATSKALDHGEGKKLVRYSNYSDDYVHEIEFDEKEHVVTIKATEGHEIWNAEGWYTIKYSCQPGKVHQVWKTFIECCSWVEGNVEPIPLEKK